LIVTFLSSDQLVTILSAIPTAIYTEQSLLKSGLGSDPYPAQ
jgi:hypothetical protein